MGDGFFPKEIDWVELFEHSKYNDGWRSDGIACFDFQMSMDTKEYSRSVYSILDFLGDVASGGLLSILLPIGGIIVASLDYLTDRTLDVFIIKMVFFNRKSNDPN